MSNSGLFLYYPFIMVAVSAMHHGVIEYFTTMFLSFEFNGELMTKLDAATTYRILHMNSAP
jgi:hypothetical protein